MKRSQKYLMAFCFIVSLAIVLMYLPIIKSLDQSLLDKQFKLLNKLYLPELAKDIVIIGIDEKTERLYREPLALWHPHLGRAFSALALSKPKAVVVDLILPDKSYEFMQQGIDRQLLSGMLVLKKSVPLIIARTVDKKGMYRPLFAPIASLLGEKNIGLALIRSDTDHVVRQLLLEIQAGSSTAATLTGALASSLALNPQQGLINYTLNSGFQYIPLSQLNDWSHAGDIGSLKQAFSNKVIFIGSVMPFVDRHRAPLPIAAWEAGNLVVPGVLLHAQSAATIMQDAAIFPMGKFWMLIFAFMITLPWWLGNRHKLAILVLVLSTVLLPVVSTFLLSREIWLPIGGLLLILYITVLSRLAMAGLFAWQDRRQLNASFSRYVSPRVMDEIIEGKIMPGVGGKRCTVCVLFSDIRGFTSRSEGEEPEVTIKLLNRYFNEMTDVVHRHGGTVDKFIGDGPDGFFRRSKPAAGHG